MSNCKSIGEPVERSERLSMSHKHPIKPHLNVPCDRSAC